MTMSSFLIVALIFILSGVIILRPLFDPKVSRSAAASGRYDALLAEKERLYSIIEELDQSLDLGKISAQDHSTSRAELLNQAAKVLAELDKIRGKKKVSQKPKASPMADDELEEMIQARRESLNSRSSQVCPKCGEPAGQKDQFCSQCGESL